MIAGLKVMSTIPPADPAAQRRLRDPAGRRIRDHGTDEGRWRAWLHDCRPVAWPLDRWVSHAQRLVAVMPHPDDEVLACGGLLAAHAARAGALLLVAVTEGEASHGRRAPGGTTRLAARRAAERRAGLRHLGLANAPILQLGLPDGGVQAHEEALLKCLRATLRRGDVVVATWRYDGHPDHDTVGRCAVQAASEIGSRCLEAPVWMWNWSGPADPRIPWPDLHALPLDESTRAAKRAALSMHRSQLTPRPLHQPPVLSTSIVAQAHRHDEHFFITPEPPCR